MTSINNTFCSIIDESIFFHFKNYSSSMKLSDLDSIKVLKIKKLKINKFLILFTISTLVVGFFVPIYYKYVFWFISLTLLVLIFRKNTEYNLVIDLKNNNKIVKKIEKDEKEIAKKSVSIILNSLKENKVIA
jgi:hypothetical protein